MDKNVFYPRVAEIVWKHIENDENNIHSVRKELIECNKIFQFAYSKLTLKPTVLLKDGVLISEMNFIWNSGSGKAKTTKVWRATAATTNWSYSKRTANWKGSWRGKPMSKEKKSWKKKNQTKKRRLIAVKNKYLKRFTKAQKEKANEK